MLVKTISNERDSQHPLLKGGSRRERDAARFIGVTYEAMKMARLQGRPYVPYIRVGRTILYRNEDLLRCLEEGYRTS